MSSPFLFLKAQPIPVLCSQQDMKDEEITDGEEQKPKADTIGVMTIGTAGTREPFANS